MCLVLLAVRAHPLYPLVVAANRDEFHARPSAPARFWEDAPGVLAGRDLEKGGAWLGVTRSGRVAALTNFRDPRAVRHDAASRGALVSGFLSGAASAEEWLGASLNEAPRYNPFNLVAGVGARLLVHAVKLGPAVGAGQQKAQIGVRRWDAHHHRRGLFGVLHAKPSLGEPFLVILDIL
ncbi:NRDE family protein [Acidobacteria bacterium ACD]|nr:NRDE family protein [Acidobacteria bacterium ACD]